MVVSSVLVLVTTSTNGCQLGTGTCDYEYQFLDKWYLSVLVLVRTSTIFFFAVLASTDASTSTSTGKSTSSTKFQNWY
jgi:hypothetical protein